jgi:hypothetical protein
MLRASREGHCTRFRASEQRPERLLVEPLPLGLRRKHLEQAADLVPMVSGTNPRSRSYFMISYSRIVWSRQGFHVSCEMRRWSWCSLGQARDISLSFYLGLLVA